jgi:uncharacterized phiE125 gp8 family phage protein
MLRVVEQPALAVSLSDAKSNLGIAAGDTSKDARVTALITTATNEAQALVQRRFVRQTLEWVLNGWRPVLRLPVAPVVPAGVQSIKFSRDGDDLTLEPERYVAQSAGPTVALRPASGNYWPMVDCDASEPIVIRFVAGEAAADVPAHVTTAIMFGVQRLWNLGARDAALTQDAVTGIGSWTYDVARGEAVMKSEMGRLLLQEAW